MNFFIQAMNAVGAYFNRNWGIEEMTNTGILPLYAHRCLKKMYLTLFGAMLSSTVGSFFHLIWDVGGFCTVLTAAGSIIFLFNTLSLEVRMRILWLMAAACSIGASVGLFAKYLFGIDQGFVSSSLAGTTIGFGTFWVGAWSTRRRSLFICCMLVSTILMFVWFAIAADIFGGHTARWMLWVWAVLGWYMGYIVVYSKEVTYDARFGDVDFVNRAFTNLFHLPAIVVHVVSLQVLELVGCFILLTDGKL